MESIVTGKNQGNALEILPSELSFEEIVELSPNQYPKGAEKKSQGEGWSLWVKDGSYYAVVLGIGVFLVKP